MKIAIVAYPDLAESDRRWIEGFRTRHDLQASRIALHFTLVFPVDATPDQLATEILEVVRSSEPIRFAIRRAEIVPDRANHAGHHIFLVSDEGSIDIVKLHDRLYAGSLRPHLRTDISFVPHITVGLADSEVVARRWVREIDFNFLCITGTLRSIDLVDVEQHRVCSVATYVLGSAEAVDPGATEAV